MRMFAKFALAAVTVFAVEVRVEVNVWVQERPVAMCVKGTIPNAVQLADGLSSPKVDASIKGSAWDEYTYVIEGNASDPQAAR